jgi:carbonic anhydrase
MKKSILCAVSVAALSSLLALTPLNASDASAPGGASAAHETACSLSGSEALARLKAGNARFVAGKQKHADNTPSRRTEIAQAQTPYAIILACADSRVPPELLFDEGLGDLFVVRVAGNVIDPHVLGSIEYAVEHLGSNLIVVLGHQRCGAVAASCSVLSIDGHAPGNVQSLVDAIAPAVATTKGQPLDSTIAANTTHSMMRLQAESELVRERIRAGTLKVVGGRYNLDTGEVTYLGE